MLMCSHTYTCVSALINWISFLDLCFQANSSYTHHNATNLKLVIHIVKLEVVFDRMKYFSLSLMCSELCPYNVSDKPVRKIQNVTTHNSNI